MIALAFRKGKMLSDELAERETQVSIRLFVHLALHLKSYHDYCLANVDENGTNTIPVVLCFVFGAQICLYIELITV